MSISSYLGEASHYISQFLSVQYFAKDLSNFLCEVQDFLENWIPGSPEIFHPAKCFLFPGCKQTHYTRRQQRQSNSVTEPIHSTFLPAINVAQTNIVYPDVSSLFNHIPTWKLVPVFDTLSDRQTERQPSREVGRQTDMQVDRQADSWAGRQADR